MTCSVLPIRDCQPHSQLARRWLVLLGAVGLTVTLCPGTCSLTEMVTVTSDSVGDDRTYPVGKPVTNVPACGSEVLGRGRLDHGPARLKIATPWRCPAARPAVKAGKGWKVSRPPENRRQQEATQFC
jgi:hypothetical protein